MKKIVCLFVARGTGVSSVLCVRGKDWALSEPEKTSNNSAKILTGTTGSSVPP